MFLTILLLTCIYTIIAIFLLKLQDIRHQISLFVIIYILMYLFYIICRMMNTKKIKNVNKLEKKLVKENKKPQINAFKHKINTNNNNNTNTINTNDLDLTQQKVDIKQEKGYTIDKIIPISSYNQRDCTNDNSCIIQPNKHNLFPGFEKDNGDYKVMISKPSCNNCGKLLSLLNKPTSEKFSKNPYDISHNCGSVNDKNLSQDQNVCIHCQQYTHLL